MSSRILYKYPGEIRTYAIDWSQRLSNANDGSADTLATSSWTADSGITIDSNSTSGNTALVQVSGGTGNETYKLKNTITLATSSNQLDDFLIIEVVAEPVV